MEEKAPGNPRKHKMASSSLREECPSVTKKRRLDFGQPGGDETDPTRPDCKRKRPAAGMPEAECSHTAAKRLRIPSSARPCSAKRQRIHSDETSCDAPFLSAEKCLKDPGADKVKSPSLPYVTAVTHHWVPLVESRTVTQEDGKKQASSSPKGQQQSLLDESKEHTKSHSSDTALSTEKAQAQQRLHQHGVPLLTRRDVQDMSSAGVQSLGSGTYGSCHKVVDPSTLKPLVVKTFSDDGLQELITEAINLHELRLPGVQELVGVCLDTRQIVTHFGGTTVDQFFETKPSLADKISVFLQIARILQNMLQRGFAHNDIKGNNVCVQVDNDPPKATVIDLGLARKVGTLEIYEEMPDTRKLPWLAPELLRYTHPCGEASDVYSMAHLLRKKLPLKKKRGKSCSLAGVEDWAWRGQRLDPSKRPSLAILIELLEALYKEASKDTKE